MFDRTDDIHATLASQCGLELFSFNDLVSQGFHLNAQEKEEPNADSLLILGVTSGTTGEPKFAMLTHINCISG
jgi:long-subunit acyl-CoA synthetase (AMP-forming)